MARSPELHKHHGESSSCPRDDREERALCWIGQLGPSMRGVAKVPACLLLFRSQASEGQPGFQPPDAGSLTSINSIVFYCSVELLGPV